MADNLLPPGSFESSAATPSEGSETFGHRWRTEQPEEAGGLSFDRYIAALRRFKWLVVAVSVVGTALGYYVAKSTVRQYSVTATIWVGASGGGQQAEGPIRAHEMLQSSSWADLVRAPTILDGAVLDQRLYVWSRKAKDAPLLATLQPDATTLHPCPYELRINETGTSYTLLCRKEVVEEGVLGDTIGRHLGFRWAPPASELKPKSSIFFTVTTLRDAANGLGSSLNVSLPDQSNFMRIELVGSDAQQAARTVNSVVRRFIQTAADLKKRNLIEFERTLNSQLEYSQEALHAAETALENFRVKAIMLPTEGTAVAGGLEATRDPVLKEYFDRKLDYDNVRHDREALERALNDVQSGSATLGVLQTLPAIQSAPPELKSALDELTAKQAALRAAEHTYTDEHPLVKDLRQQIATLQTQTIPALTGRVVEGMRRHEGDLDSRIKGASQDLQNIPTRTIEEMRLRRDVAVKENLYTLLKNRYEEAQLATASAIPDVTVLDTAVAPMYPVSNQAPRVMFLAMVGSVGAALALAILLDRMDRRVRYPDQVTKQLGLPIVGAVQSLRRSRSGDNNPVEAAQVIEAFRSLRMHVTQAFPRGTQVQLVISSAGPGEGKSLVAANLSLCFAEAGIKTLLIDGDIRRGQLHALFGVERRPGLVDVLMDSVSPDLTLRRTSHPCLTLMASGSRRQRGPEHLGSEAVRDLLNQFRSEYDVIIIDSPPLNAGIDPFVLSTLTGNMLFVVRSGVTDYKMAAAKLATMDRLPVRLLGAVLNGIRSQYSEYRYYSYAAGYGLSEGQEEDEPMRLAPIGKPRSRTIGRP